MGIHFSQHQNKKPPAEEQKSEKNINRAYNHRTISFIELNKLEIFNITEDNNNEQIKVIGKRNNTELNKVSYI